MGVVAVILIAAVFTFLNYSGQGKEKKAQAAAVGAQQFFQQQQWQSAIDGNEESMGFTEIADTYGKTSIGNLAHYYLGVSYMKTGEYQKSLDQLTQYKPTKDPNINGLAFMNMGDASMELGNTDEALSYYEKAADTESEAFTADFLMRYALAQLQANDNEGAKESFKKLASDYPNSSHSNVAEQYIAGL